ncbi:hypothetical protein SLS58_005264 [Diplodia intermedia]|uniref:Amidoligase enzyme n=1 Tax=Diplodia intermedia TaxID=856260 RepID=A0ABR3TR59_9PEZI
MSSAADIPRENGSDIPLEGNGSDFPIDVDMDGDCDISMGDRSPSASSSSSNFSDASFIPDSGSSCGTPPIATSWDAPQRPKRRAALTNVSPLPHRPPTHPSLTDPSVPLPLTIGIEFEMLFVYEIEAAKADYGLTGPAALPDEKDQRVILMVAQALRDAGVDVSAEPEMEELDEELDDGPEAPFPSFRDPEAKYTSWEIGYDMSAGDMHASWEALFGQTDGPHSEYCPCRREGTQEWGGTEFMRHHRRKGEYGFFGLELRSPKYVGDGWQDDVRRTLEALHELFDDRLFGDSYRLYQHDTTGVHVHVGVGTQTDRYRLPLESVKSFMQLVTGFERITDELHAVTRFDSRGAYCKPPSQNYVGREVVESDGKLGTMLRRCQEIEQVGHVHDMAGFHNRESAYNLQNLRTDEDGEFSAGSLGTIEFRQHRGTLDADEVTAWVEVATSMVRFAHKTALTSNMLSMVKGHAYDPQMGFDPFLRMIGVADKTVDYYGRCLEAGLDCDAREQSSELRGSRLSALTHDLAHRRQQQKQPIYVTQAIILRLLSGDYGLPEEVVSRLLREKYPPVGPASTKYRWSDWWKR